MVVAEVSGAKEGLLEAHHGLAKGRVGASRHPGLPEEGGGLRPDFTMSVVSAQGHVMRLERGGVLRLERLGHLAVKELPAWRQQLAVSDLAHAIMDERET